MLHAHGPRPAELDRRRHTDRRIRAGRALAHFTGFERVNTSEKAMDANFARLMAKRYNVCTPPNSFVAGTPVLLADGTSRPIEDIRVNDRVLSTDTASDETDAQPVTGLITNSGDKDLVDITVDVSAECTGGSGRRASQSGWCWPRCDPCIRPGSCRARRPAPAGSGRPMMIGKACCSRRVPAHLRGELSAIEFDAEGRRFGGDGGGGCEDGRRGQQTDDQGQGDPAQQ